MREGRLAWRAVRRRKEWRGQKGVHDSVGILVLDVRICVQIHNREAKHIKQIKMTIWRNKEIELNKILPSVRT